MDEKLKNEDKQILLVVEGSDAKKELKVVTEIEGDKLKSVNPSKGKASDFLAIDKHSTALENFFKKFLEQAKNPASTGFFLVMKKVFDQFIKMSPIREEQLEPYRIDPKKFIEEKQRQAEQSQEGSKAEQNKPFEPIDENKINWEQAEKMGITKKMLEDSGNLKAMLYGYKSPHLADLAFQMEGVSFNPQARLSLMEMPDGTYHVQPHCYQVKPNLDSPFMGAMLSARDKEQLLTNYNAGRVIELEPAPGQKVPALVSLDKITNRLEAVPLDSINISSTIKDASLSPEQVERIKKGEKVLIEGMTSKSTQGSDHPKIFDAYVQYNAAKKNFDFTYDGLNKQGKDQSQQQEQNSNVRIPQRLLGVELTPKEQDALRGGEAIYVKGMVKEGQEKPFNAYVCVNKEKMKFDFFKWDPNKVKKNIANEAQAAVSSGKVAKEPIKQGQNQPTAQQKEVKPVRKRTVS